jgi:hypothetical protein
MFLALPWARLMAFQDAASEDSIRLSRCSPHRAGDGPGGSSYRQYTLSHPLPSSGGKAKGTEALLGRFRACALSVADTTYFRGALGFRLDLVLRGLGKG